MYVLNALSCARLGIRMRFPAHHRATVTVQQRKDAIATSLYIPIHSQKSVTSSPAIFSRAFGLLSRRRWSFQSFHNAFGRPHSLRRNSPCQPSLSQPKISLALTSCAQRRMSSRRSDVKEGASKNVERESGKSLGTSGPQKLSEDIFTVPNMLTIARLASTPVLGWFVLHDEMPYALALLAVSAFTDVLDGYLARRYRSATVFGSIADPAADKALMTVMVGALAWRGLIPTPLVLLIIGRDVGLVLSAFVIRWQSLPHPKTFARYWDPRLPSAKVQPTQVSKYNTFLQVILVGLCTLLASLNDEWRLWWSTRNGLWQDTSVAPSPKGSQRTDEHQQIAKYIGSGNDRGNNAHWGDATKKIWHSFMLLVALTTVWSGASYLFGSSAVLHIGRMARERRFTKSTRSDIRPKS